MGVGLSLRATGSKIGGEKPQNIGALLGVKLFYWENIN